MRPVRYLYLVDSQSDELRAVFSVDHLASEADVIAFELDLRAKHRLDDPDIGLELRDSADRPLSEEVLAQLRWKRA